MEKRQNEGKMRTITKDVNGKWNNNGESDIEEDKPLLHVKSEHEQKNETQQRDNAPCQVVYVITLPHFLRLLPFDHVFRNGAKTINFLTLTRSFVKTEQHY